MMQIRRATNWNDPKAVKEANERVQQLTAQLESLRLKQEAAKAGATATEAAEAADSSVLNRATVRKQVEESAARGRGAGIDLAEKVRDEIVEVYEEDRNLAIKNPEVRAELAVLIIDFSLPQSSFLIDQLDQFKSVRTLILLGPGSGIPPDLARVFEKAKKLPLQELHIINFKWAVSILPDSLAFFPGLTTLNLCNNSLSHLPAALGQLHGLTTLSLDGNPLPSVLPTISTLHSLKELGLVKTRITATEVAAIQQSLPACKVVFQ